MKRYLKILCTVVICFICLFSVVGCSNNTYSISLETNNNSYGQVFGAGTYKKGTSVRLVAVANDGYEFEEWRESNGAKTYKYSVLEFKVEKSINLTAVFKEKVKVKSAVIDSVTVELEYDDYDKIKKLSYVMLKYIAIHDSKDNWLVDSPHNQIDTYLVKYDDRGLSLNKYTYGKYIENEIYTFNEKIELGTDVRNKFSIIFDYSYLVTSENWSYSGNVFLPESNDKMIFTEDKNSIKVLYGFNNYFKIYITFNYHIEQD